MIPIKIGKKKFRLKSYDELSVKEFIYLMERLPDEFTEIDYISIMAKVDKDVVLMGEQKEFKKIKKGIGSLRDVTKYNYSGSMLVGKDIVLPELGKVGQRIMIEQASSLYKDNMYEFYIFVLAVAIKGVETRFDFNKVSKYKDLLMNRPYYETLGTGYFFFLQFLNGSKEGMSVSMRLSIATKTLLKEAVLALKNLMNFRSYMILRNLFGQRDMIMIK